MSDGLTIALADLYGLVHWHRLLYNASAMTKYKWQNTATTGHIAGCLRVYAVSHVRP